MDDVQFTAPRKEPARFLVPSDPHGVIEDDVRSEQVEAARRS